MKKYSGGLSVSTIDLYERCNYAFFLGKIEKFKEAVNSSGAVGLAFHEWRQNYSNYLIRSEVSHDTAMGIELIPKSALVWNDYGYPEFQFAKRADYDTFQELCERDMNRKEDFSHILEAATVTVEDKIGLNNKWQRVGWMSPDIFFRLKMDLFWIDSEGDKKGNVLDYKTGWNEMDEDEMYNDLQCRVYAYAAMKLYNLEVVDVILKYVRSGHAPKVTFEWSDVLDVPTEIEAKHKEITSQTEWNPSLSATACAHCGHKKSCEPYREKHNFTDLVERSYLDKKVPWEIKSDPEAASLARELAIWKGKVSVAESHLKEWVRENGAVYLDGEMYDRNTSPRVSISGKDLIQLVKLLLTKIDMEKIFKKMTLSQTSLKQLCTKRSGFKDKFEDLVDAFGEARESERFDYVKIVKGE